MPDQFPIFGVISTVRVTIALAGRAPLANPLGLSRIDRGVGFAPVAIVPCRSYRRLESRRFFRPNPEIVWGRQHIAGPIGGEQVIKAAIFADDNENMLDR